MKLKIKTIWHQGFKRIGVPEKYIKDAIKKKESIEFQVGEETMILEGWKIEALVKGFSPYFEDKFGRDKYRLAYFDWTPTTEDEQQRLFVLNL